MSAPGTPKASEAAIAAVQNALGCNLRPRQTRAVKVDGFTIGGGIETGCQTHRDQYGLPQKSERGCPVAVAAADAAVKAAAPAIAAKARRTKHCGCAWCCQTTKPEQRGNGHSICRDSIDPKPAGRIEAGQ